MALTSDVGEETGGEVFNLLANNEPEGSKHGNATVGDLRFAPSPELLDCKMRKDEVRFALVSNTYIREYSSGWSRGFSQLLKIGYCERCTCRLMR
jgi:hypothetical protein